MSARRRLAAGAALVLASLVAAPASSPATTTPPDVDLDHRLRLFNTHTGERVDVVYRRGTQYLPNGLRALERHLRDHRTGDVHRFDPALFDLLSDLAAEVGRPDGEFQIISGYRSPKTNEMLRSSRNGVAKRSLHMEAQAIDVRLAGVDTSVLRDAALGMKRGGVGYYGHQDFIHVDTGRVRRW